MSARALFKTKKKTRRIEDKEDKEEEEEERGRERKKKRSLGGEREREREREKEEEEERRRKNDDDDDAHAGVVDLVECLENVRFSSICTWEGLERKTSRGSSDRERTRRTARRRLEKAQRHMFWKDMETTKRVQTRERKTSALLSSTTRSDRFRKAEKKTTLNGIGHKHGTPGLKRWKIR